MPKGRPPMKPSTRARNAKTSIDTDAKIGGIREHASKQSEFICTCCGKAYKNQRNNFPYTASPLYASNNQRLPYCKNCVAEYFKQLTDFFSGNEVKAAERMCQINDWFFLEDIWDATRNVSREQERITIYSSRMCFTGWKKRGTTYLDTIKESATTALSSYSDYEDLKENDATTISRAQLDRWGIGFDEAEYKQLDAHYKMLRETIDTNDVIQDNLAKDLCEIKIQQIRARNRGDADSFQRFTKLYQDTLKTANLKVKSGEKAAVDVTEEHWGNYVKMVEQYCPAEFYEDKSLFDDFDGIKEYFERFILRPVKNWLFGTREMDPEFSIGAEEEEDGRT